MSALIVAAHHLRRLARNPVLILLLLAIPVTLAVIEYGAFGSGVASGRLPPARVLVLDDDQSLVSRMLPQVFAGAGLKDFFEVASVADRTAARRQFERNQAAALIIVPKGFQQAVLAGEPARLGLAKNPIQTFAPDMAEGVLEVGVMIGNSLYAEARQPIERIRAMQQASRVATNDEFAEISRGFFDAGQRLARLELLGTINVTIARPGASRTSRLGADPGAFFAYVFPGLMIFALLFLSQALAGRLLRDRLRGLQRRLATTPTSRTAVLLGSIVYLLAGLGIALALLVGLGAVLFRIPLRHPGSLLLLGGGFCVFAAGLQFLVMAAARSERVAAFVSTVLILVLSLAGGSFVPVELYPEWLQQVAFLVPNGAAQQGLIDTLVHGRSLAQIAGRIGTLWLWGTAVLAAAVLAERRRLQV